MSNPYFFKSQESLATVIDIDEDESDSPAIPIQDDLKEGSDNDTIDLQSDDPITENPELNDQ